MTKGHETNQKFHLVSNFARVHVGGEGESQEKEEEEKEEEGGGGEEDQGMYVLELSVF